MQTRKHNTRRTAEKAKRHGLRLMWGTLAEGIGEWVLVRREDCGSVAVVRLPFLLPQDRIFFVGTKDECRAAAARWF